MSEDRIMGIVINSTREFYYMDRGVLGHGNSVDKLRNVLISRRLLGLNDDGKYTSHSIISLAEAKLKDYNINTLYINQHTKKSIEELQRDKRPTSSPWK